MKTEEREIFIEAIFKKLGLELNSEHGLRTAVQLGIDLLFYSLENIDVKDSDKVLAGNVSGEDYIFATGKLARALTGKVLEEKFDKKTTLEDELRKAALAGTKAAFEEIKKN